MSLHWRDGFECEIGDQVVRANHEQSGWMIWGCCQVGEKKVGLVDPHGIKRWCLPDCFILMITAMDGAIREVERLTDKTRYDINMEPLLNAALAKLESSILKLEVIDARTN